MIVYGSIFNPGIRYLYPKELSPLSCALVTGAICAAMYTTAMMWRDYKLTRPRAAFWTLVTLGVLFVAVFFLNPVP